MTDHSQDTPQQDQCTIHVGGKRCTESADGPSGLCFLHDPDLTADEREQIARKKGAESLKAYIEEKAKHKKLPWGVRLEGADLSHAHLERAELATAHLESANLFKAHLEGAELQYTHLEGARLRVASLEVADLVEAHFEGADLRGADLKGANLLGAHLDGARLSYANLSATRGLSVEHLGQVAPNVEAYRSFKRAFVEMGRDDGASRAAFLQQQRHRKALAMDMRRTWRKPGITEWAWLADLGKWLLHGVVEILCGYFEKPWRPVRWSAVIVLLFALVYSQFDAFTPYPISGNDGAYEAEVKLPARDAPTTSPAKTRFLLRPVERDEQKASVWDAVYFSAVTFTTLGYGDFRPRAEWRPVAAIEAAIGAFMIALFVVTLSHRFVAR